MATTTSTDDIWSEIEFDLSELRDLFHMRLETKKEAVGKRTSTNDQKAGRTTGWRDTAPRWVDEEHGNLVRPWLMIPYVDAIDQDLLQEYTEAGKQLLASVEQKIASRELTPDLLQDWGQLNRWAGAIQLAYFSESSVGHARSALAGGEARTDDVEAHQRWFAHYFLKQYSRGKREEAEKAVERLINAIIDGEIALPNGWDIAWFESYLKLGDSNEPDYAMLRPAYDQNALSVRRMNELVVSGTDGIPPVDLEIPDP